MISWMWMRDWTEAEPDNGEEVLFGVEPSGREPVSRETLVRVLHESPYATYDSRGERLKANTAVFAPEELAHWDRAAKKIVEWRRKMRRILGRAVYLRSGFLPDWRSYNQRDKCYEGGVSVFDAWETPTGDYVVDTKRGDRDTLISQALQDRPWLIVSGKETGVGGDGEPLLSDVRVIKRVPRRTRIYAMPESPVGRLWLAVPKMHDLLIQWNPEMAEAQRRHNEHWERLHNRVGR